MRNIVIFQFVMAFLLVSFVPTQGFAGSFGKYIWGPPKSDFVRPYLEEAKLPHNSQWADDEWSPQDWVEARGGNVVNVVNGFYTAGIIVDQYFDGDIPVFEVGQTFIDLSGQEKRRVVAFMDDVFGVTKLSDQGVILLYFHQNGDTPVGLSNAQGLQIQ